MRVERIMLSAPERPGLGTGGRLIRTTHVELSPKFNVIIGRNGAGKSTLIRVLARVLSRWTTGNRDRLLPDADAPLADVRIQGVAPDGRQFVARGRLETHRTERRRGRHQVAFEGEHDPRGQRFLDRADTGDVSALPVIAHASPRVRNTSRSRLIGPPTGSRLRGYQGSMEIHMGPDSSGWWESAIDDVDPEVALDTIKTAFLVGVPGLEDVRWDGSLGTLIAVSAGGTLPWRHLPASTRSVMSLVGSLAWRGAVLSGAIGRDSAKSIGGVVLCEDIEAHLHPNWQRRIVGDLSHAFPCIQFIATTNSPFVVQSMQADEVINLDGLAPMDYWREGIEDIATQSMGVEGGKAVPRSELYRELESAAAEYYKLLDAQPPNPEAIAQKKARLDELEAEFTDNPALAAFLRMHRLATEAET